jgi:hypothetical protein
LWGLSLVRSLACGSYGGARGWWPPEKLLANVHLLVGGGGATTQRLVEVVDSQQRGQSFFSKIQSITRFYKNFCKQKARESREEETQVRDQLEKATASL